MFDLETLRDYESRGVIKSSTRDGYTVWCYTQETVFTQNWDDVSLSCRGLVLAPDGTLIGRPFRKFFNWDQPQGEAAMERGPFYAYEKMDGTLIVVCNHDGEPVVSTKGSFDTWHSETARDLLMGFVPAEGTTALFELIHPANRVVVNYYGQEKLVFLGAVRNENGAEFHPETYADENGWAGDVVTQVSLNLPSMLKTIQNPENGDNREGFVLVWPKKDGPSNRVKLKFAQYIALHGIYTGLTSKRVWEHMSAGTLDDLIEIAPDELHPAIAECSTEILRKVDAWQNEAGRLAEEATALSDRRSVAEFFQKQSPRELASLAFMAYDGKTDRLRDAAYRLAKPEVSEPLGTFNAVQGTD